MSAAEADRFIADVKADPDRFRDFEEMASSGRHAEAYAKVRSLGYDATSDEIREAFLAYLSDEGVELDEATLAAVAGGLSDGQIGGAVAAGGVIVVVIGIAAAAAA